MAGWLWLLALTSLMFNYYVDVPDLDKLISRSCPRVWFLTNLGRGMQNCDPLSVENSNYLTP